MSGRVVFVLVDGLRADAAPHMGWLAAMAGAGKARAAVMDCELPPLSRPLYHCIFTGQEPMVSGIVHNTCWRMPAAPPPDMFARAVAGGLRTAAAAYYWVSELCNGAPWDAATGRIADDPALPIQRGLFYCNDAYPDDHVFMDAEALRQRHAPHLLLAHTMGVDEAGHSHGGQSAACRNAVRQTDMLLARYAPRWLEAGYTVIVTSDHGMSADGLHNDSTPDVRRVPLWVMDAPGVARPMGGRAGAEDASGVADAPGAAGPPDTRSPHPASAPLLPLPQRQTQWCAFVCALLGV